MTVDSLYLLRREAEGETEPENGWGLADQVWESIERTCRYFTRSQHPEGYWWFELESNVTITAEYLMLLVFAGIRDEEKTAKMVRHILRQQRSDGTWAIFKGGKADISTTVEAYFALKLAGYSSEDPRLEKAGQFVLANGGLSRTRVFTKIFLALFGQYDWKSIPSVPVEINLLFSWLPFSIYSFSSWARATFVPLSVVLDGKPVKAIPDERGVPELVGNIWDDKPADSRRSIVSWKSFFLQVDKFVKLTEGSRMRLLRKRGPRSGAPVDTGTPGRDRRLGRDTARYGQLNSGAAHARLRRILRTGAKGLRSFGPVYNREGR